MDRLDFSTNQTLPVYLKDFEYLQDIYKNLFKGIFGAVQNGSENINFIISGCEMVSNDVSEGFIYLNGEVLYCEGATDVPAQPSATYLYKNITYDSDGDRTAGDNNVHHAYVQNRALVMYGTVPNPPYLTLTGLRYADMIRNQANPVWIDPPTFTAPYTNNNLKYRKVGNYLEMKGSINNTTGVFTGNIFTIPDSNCRPIVLTKLPVIIDPIAAGYNAKSANLSINSNGMVMFETANVAPPGYNGIYINVRIPLD